VDGMLTKYYDKKLKDYVLDAGEMLKAVSVSANQDYTLTVEFSTGEVKNYDMKPLLEYPAFLPLKNSVLFGKPYIRCGGVVWNDEVDIAPEELYKNGILI
jgi:hypothetical protein